MSEQMRPLASSSGPSGAPDLASDVRRRLTTHVSQPAYQTPLPLAGRLVQVADQPVATEAQADQRGGPGQGFTGGQVVYRQAEPGGAAPPGETGANAALPGNPPTPEQVAERVYQLLQQDLRSEREREGW